VTAAGGGSRPADSQVEARTPDIGERAATASASARPARRLAGLPAALRRHWLAAALLGLGLVLRVLAQFAYRPALFYIDSVKYLYNAEGNDPEGYKAPLRAILFVSNLDTVIALQHLLGLVIAVVIYRLLLRRGVSRWLAALAMAPVLLDAYQLQMEQTIMPGTVFEGLILAGLAILLWKPVSTWPRVVAAGLLLGTSATVAQVGEAMILPAAIYLLAAGGGWRQAIGKAVTMVVACAVPILLYCTGSYLLTGDFYLSHSGVTSLYGRTAAAVDCATIKLTPLERGICPTPAQQARGDDWLEFGVYAPVQHYYNTLPRAEVDSVVSAFNHAVLTQQPLRLAKAYGRDVLKIYSVTRHTDGGDTPISRWQFQTSFPYFTNHASRPEVDAIVRQFGGGLPAVWHPVADFLRSYQLDGGYTAGPLLLLCTLTGLAGSVLVLRRRLDPAIRQLGRVPAADLRLVRVLLALPDPGRRHHRARRRAGHRHADPAGQVQFCAGQRIFRLVRAVCVRGERAQVTGKVRERRGSRGRILGLVVPAPDLAGIAGIRTGFEVRDFLRAHRATLDVEGVDRGRR
jgi:hypothetical protein